MHKGYFGTQGSQIHFREMGNGEVPIICLPPAPHTGAYFETLMPYLAKGNRVIAIDYPGYGGSDRLNVSASIPKYAARLLSSLSDFETVDLLGFHTGNLVALEMSLQMPSNIRNMIMIDVPYFDASTRAAYIDKFPASETPSNLEATFIKSVEERHETVSEDRAIALWVETLRSGRLKNDAFRASFSYDCEKIFPRLKKPVTVIATQSRLLEQSRTAASILPQGVLIEKLDITAPVFEAHSKAVAELIVEAFGT